MNRRGVIGAATMVAAIGALFAGQRALDAHSRPSAR